MCYNDYYDDNYEMKWLRGTKLFWWLPLLAESETKIE